MCIAVLFDILLLFSPNVGKELNLAKLAENNSLSTYHNFLKNRMSFGFMYFGRGNISVRNFGGIG